MNKEKIIEYRRHIHSNPELSFKEYKTNAYVCNILKNMGLKFNVMCETGIVATIGNENSADCIAFRCELDALPMCENTGLPFSSKNEGVMHSCGHDLHIAMLLGAAEIFSENLPANDRCVKLIFQPGEEVLPGGAKSMIAAGVLSEPRPKFIFAQHIDPDLPVGTIGIAGRRAMAATCEFKITIHGKATHGATPHKGSEPIVVAANIITLTNSFLVRYNNPFEPAVLSICAINGGNVNNAFPASVEMLGTLRCYNEDLRNKYLAMYQQKCQQLAAVYGTKCDMEIVYGYPPVINDADAVDVVRRAVATLPDVKLQEIEPKMWAEDFSYYGLEVPSCFYFLGVSPDGETLPPLHSSELNPSEEALIVGVEVMDAIRKVC
ncbi:MAG: amidohydrolase [Ignavibacteria bacterium]|jgi:amidohydrolase|nr:amidohydrolase [Ignavibacteria bacterium]